LMTDIEERRMAKRVGLHLDIYIYILNPNMFNKIK
jgi:hypothetical protein